MRREKCCISFLKEVGVGVVSDAANDYSFIILINCGIALKDLPLTPGSEAVSIV